MKLRKRERIAIGLALAALAALVFDRLISDPGGSPAPASALAGTSPSAAKAAPRSSEAESGPSGSDDGHAADLQEYDALAPARDPFSLTPRLLAGFRQATAAIEVEHQAQLAEETRTIDEFRAVHRLDAVLLSSDHPLAIVNGRELQLGQSVSGYVLVAVEPLSATFQSQGRQVRLYVPLINR